MLKGSKQGSGREKGTEMKELGQGAFQYSIIGMVKRPHKL